MSSTASTRTSTFRRLGAAGAATLALVAGGSLAGAESSPADAAGLGSAGHHKSHKKHHKKKHHKKKSHKKGKHGSCKASYYASGSRTASGERFHPHKLTAAHKKLKFGTKVKVTNKKNGKSVTVRINDRGPYAGGRCMDLSKGAMKKVKGLNSGVIKIKWKVVAKPKK